MMKYNKYIYITLVFIQLACQVAKKPLPKTNQVASTKSKEDIFTISSTTPPLISTPSVAESKPEPVALTVGNVALKTADLKFAFENQISEDSLSPKAFLEQVINDQRIIADAKKRGYDTTASFKQEIEDYRSTLAEAYLTDSTTIKALLKETYEWMKEEVRVAHIMYPISEFAEPTDTLAIYNKLVDIRNRALTGEDFDTLAQQFSQDKKTNSVGGDLGWFRAIRFLYPLEKAAYTTPVGQISMPVRTKGGYHIVKVLGRRPYSGSVLVQHILKTVQPNAIEAESLKAKNTLDSLREVIAKGGISFEDACKKYSDDTRYRNFGGFLPVFGIGGREEVSFEQAAFALQEGEVSKPVRTTIGWHLIKLSKKIPMESFDEAQVKLKDKIVTDSRGDVVKENTLIKLKKQMKFDEDQEVVKRAITAADTNILVKKWAYAVNNELLNKPIFNIGSKAYKTKLFFDFAVDHQTFERIPTGYTPTMVMRSFYKKFVENTVKEYAESHLEELNPDFKILMNEYSTSLLKMELLNDLVYEKSTSDTTEQRLFYEKNIVRYQMPERVQATIIASKDAKVVYQVKELLEKGKPYNLKRLYRTPLYFTKSSSNLTPDHKQTLVYILEIMRKNKGYVVEIGGHADQHEEDNISAERIEKAKAFLVANGLSIERIIENDYVKTKPSGDKFDWSKNQRVTFAFYSNSQKDVEKIFNAKEANTVSIEEGYFKHGDNKFIDLVQWVVGRHSVAKDGQFADVIIEQVEPARSKTLRECRGQVLVDYQKYLENQFKTDLINKYPVNLNQEEIDKALGIKK
ncbi:MULTISPECIES: peptidylprolyl isomerase [Emticicia]|nr:MULTISPECIES: peptidylprolyl isomerase [Emticicia]